MIQFPDGMTPSKRFIGKPHGIPSVPEAYTSPWIALNWPSILPTVGRRIVLVLSLERDKIRGGRMQIDHFQAIVLDIFN